MNLQESRRDGAKRSPENVARIELYTATFQKAEKLIFERMLAVVLLLSVDVVFNRCHLRRADAERAVAFLPGEALPHPARGTPFQFLNSGCKRVSRRQDEQQMKVVRRAACSHEGKSLTTRCSAQISEKVVHALRRDKGSSVSCAEDAMNEVVGIRVGHQDSHFNLPRTIVSAVPTALHSIKTALFPTLKRGANDRRAYGAGQLADLEVICRHRMTGATRYPLTSDAVSNEVCGQAFVDFS